MRSTEHNHDSGAVTPFRFESYGVRVEITSNKQEIVDRAAQVARRSLLGEINEIGETDFDHRFVFNQTKGGTYSFVQNDRRITSGRSTKKFYKFFDSILRVSVGEYAVDRVFMHAGVVGWNGKAILLPADSFRGKSTLVAELVKNGASYYSDEFAIFDKNALVHPFARPVAMRTTDGKYRTYELTVEELGGTYGEVPIPVGIVLLTEYDPTRRWDPKMLSRGQGVMEMIPFTLSISHRPEFAFRVLNKIAERAIITSSCRGTVETFAKTLLNFVDKHVD